MLPTIHSFAVSQRARRHRRPRGMDNNKSISASSSRCGLPRVTPTRVTVGPMTALFTAAAMVLSFRDAYAALAGSSSSVDARVVTPVRVFDASVNAGISLDSAGETSLSLNVIVDVTSAAQTHGCVHPHRPSATPTHLLLLCRPPYHNHRTRTQTWPLKRCRSKENVLAFCPVRWL